MRGKTSVYSGEYAGIEGCPFPSGFSDGSHTRILPASISSDGVTTKVHTILTFQG